MTPSHVTKLIDALVALFDPLVQAIEDVNSAETLLKDMGYQAPSGIDFLNDFSPLLGALIELADEGDDLLRSDTVPDYRALFRSLVKANRDLIRLICDIGTTLQTNFPADFLAATDIVERFPRQLADYLLVKMIERQYPVLHSSLLVTGIIDQKEVTTATTPFNTPYMKRAIRWEKLGDYLSSPLHSMQEAYGWNTDSFDYELLISNIHHFGQSIDFFSSPANPDPDTLQVLNGGTDVVTDDNADKLTILKFPLLPVLDAPIGTEIYPVLNARKDKVVGLGLGLYFDPSAGLHFPIADELSLGIKYLGTRPLNAGVQILPDQPLQLISNIFGGSGPQADLSTFIPEFTYTNTDQKILVFDSSIAKLEFASWALRAGVFAGFSGLYIETDIKGATFTIGADQRDGFLQEILPAQPTAMDFDLTVGFSSKIGLYFGGGLGMKVEIPTHISIGPITVEGITVALKPADGKIPLILGTDISVSLGPLDVVVQNMGAAVSLSFPANQEGNLGVADLAFDLTPPSGVGLAVDAQAVVGGGFLDFDPQTEQYSGVLELRIAEHIAVKGIGLLTTRLPDGSNGYSLVIIIFAHGFEPIQLGLGFTLTGIGGLLAINRTFDEGVLRAGLKNHTLDSVLFPNDPIRNAPQIISNLNKVFPPAKGHHLFGPMAQIAWGTPPLVTADVALVLEFGVRLRLLILAQVVAVLPTRDNDLLRVQMDAVGVIDFDQRTAALDATLHDSRLLKKFVLTGDMALRMTWQSSPNFALAIGGLHPAFNPPPNFPKLERIAISLSSGDNPRIRCDAYFALTANTVQFGAHAELYAAAAGFSFDGQIGFDVLLQLDPFAFVADFSAQLQLKHGSTNLFKVKVDGALAGPRPLHLKATATFEILWWDVSVTVDKTLVAGEQPPQLQPVDVLAQLQAALSNPGNWIGQLPARQRPLVTLRALPPATNQVVLHPLATFTVKQGVVPLDLTIARFGQSIPAGANLFTISGVSVGGQSQTPQPVKDFFAPAQFFAMSDDEKLSRPSFEPMVAGVSIGAGAFTFTGNSDDWLEVPAIAFDTKIIDKQANTVRPSNPTTPYQISAEHLGRQARFGAVGTSDLRRTGTAKYRTTTDKYRVVKEGWSIVAATDLAVQPVPGHVAGAPLSYTEAVQARQTMEQTDPATHDGLNILRPSEVLGGTPNQ